MLEPLIKILIVVGGLMTAAAYFVLLERKMAAWIQDRVGPNRVGIPLLPFKLFGMGQPLADGVKFILKEEYTPAHVDKRLYVLAQEGAEPIPMVVAPGVDVGMIYVFALSSIAVYGVILGGWASNNKYSFLGGLRSSAQLIAYELPLGLGILGIVLATGSMNLMDIMRYQANNGWFILAQPLGFVVFLTASFAEAARLPFDMPECEQELVGGYHTEYAGIKLLLFLVAEFLHMITASFLIVILFFGGWHFPGLGASDEISLTVGILRMVVLMAKIFVVIVFFMIIRWSWPRFRFDQLMALAWKVMLPLGMVNLVVVALLDQLQTQGLLGSGAVSNVIVMALGWAVFIASALLVGIAGPLIADNRPRMDIAPYEVDRQI